MWMAISNHITEAIDANTQSLAHIKAAITFTQGNKGAAARLAYRDLVEMMVRLNELDNQLRTFVLDINEEVKVEKEASQ